MSSAAPNHHHAANPALGLPQRRGAVGRAAANSGVPELGLEAKATIHVLIVEDEHTLRESCSSVLSHEGYNVSSCARGDEALDLVQRRKFDVVLVDLNLPNASGFEVLETCLAAKPETRAIVITGNPSLQSSLEALHLGAWDYLPKPFTASHLQILTGRACHAVLAERASELPMPDAGDGAASETLTLLGRSPAFLRTVELARKVAATDASAFFVGESGTGKDLFAQFIHQQSRRSQRPLVAVNCAALPESLLESEMFGHVKGAFTGAVRDKPGLLEVADNGTFFLDELTEMSHPIQAKLLRAIQDGVVRRVGSEGTDAVVNVRFIAATNRDPYEAMESGVLRKDLFYRLSVVPIHVPPLRDRAEDIPLLAEHFLSHYWRRHRGVRAEQPHLGDAALDELQSRPWSGNVRELQNVMEHAVVLLEPGCEIEPANLPSSGFSSQAHGPHGNGYGAPVYRDNETYHSARDRLLAQFETSYLEWLMDRAGANMSKAAKMAEVDRTTLYRLMDKHSLVRDTTIKPQ